MKHLDVYKTISRELVINGKPHSVQITISTTPDLDSDPMDQDFETEEQREEYRRKFQEGYLENIGIVVKANFCGKTGIKAKIGRDGTPKKNRRVS